MNIRDLKRAPIFDDPDTYDEIVAFAENSVIETRLAGQPRNIATLAALLVFETMVAMVNQRAEPAMLALAGAGVRPHAIPPHQAAVESHLTALRQVLRAIDLSDRPVALPTTITEAELRAAGEALLVGGRAASALGFLDDAALGWRDFRAHGNTIELRHRSPERLRRRIEGALHAEADHNARFADGEMSTGEEDFFRRVVALQNGANNWDWTHGDDLITGALEPARRAGRELHLWDLPDEMEVGEPGRFSIREFRRVVEVVHAIATVGDLVGDGLASLGATRFLRGPRERWIDVLSRHSGISGERLSRVLEYMTRRASDEPRGRGEGRAATTNAFFDLGDRELGLSVTCTMWQDPTWSLLATWTRRNPQDFGAKMGERGHQLARDIHALFEQRKWIAVLERPIPHSDLDVATAVRSDPFLIVVEAKAFLEDPVRQAEDPKAWTQLADNVDAIRSPAQFRETFRRESLAPCAIAGLLVVPAHMTPATEHGDDFGVLGVEDLHELATQSATPRELWARIKETETAAAYPLRNEELTIGRWTLRFDIGDRTALPQAMRVRKTG